MKLTTNQQNVLSCLTEEFQQLKCICEKYAEIMAKEGFKPANGFAWKSTVQKVLASLRAKEMIEYKYRGFYKRKTLK